MKEILVQNGFIEKEATLYLALLRLGEATASKIAEKTGYERTATYYTLLTMIDKGYTSYVIKKGTKTFNATPPKHLYQRMQEDTKEFHEILTDLENIQTPQEELRVEVRQGKEGLKHLYRDAIQQQKEVLGIGVDDKQYLEYDEIGLHQYYREAKRKGVTERFITTRHATTYNSPISTYRYVSKEHFQPTPFFIYGDRVVLITWKPTLTLVFMYSEELASAFRKNFELLWKHATKTPLN